VTEPTGFPNQVSAIPLSDPDLGPNGEPSVGALVRNATESMSKLFRSEVALAKAELAAEAKKGAIGSAAFVVAGTVLLYSSFFFFWFLGELLSEWLPRWAAFGIVFLLLVVLAAVTGFVGYLFVRKIRGPKKTIESVNQLSSVLPAVGGKGDHPAAVRGPAGPSVTAGSRPAPPTS